MTDLSAAQNECLRHAVTLARSEQIRTRHGLETRLRAAGHAQKDIDAALAAWKAFGPAREALKAEGWPA